MNLPVEFVSEIHRLLGNETADFMESMRMPPTISIRVNNKQPVDLNGSMVPWCEAGVYLDERPHFTADPHLHAGNYYVQEASSMFLHHVIKEYFPKAKKVLDMCAAPGGKSTLIAQVLTADSLLVCNELNKERAHILAENIQKWGNPNVVVTCNHPQDFSSLESYFDAIVVDAPCSGEGMFRKNPEAIAEWSMQNVQMCVKRQKLILAQAWNCLKPNGILVYSTCTWNREENEHQIAWLMEEKGAISIIPSVEPFTGIVTTDLGCRFYPHKVRGEGLFMAVVRKPDNGASFTNRLTRKKGTTHAITKAYDKLLTAADESIVCNDSEGVFAYPALQFQDIQHIKNTLFPLLYGVKLFDRKGNDLLPTQQLALSKWLRKDAFNTFELAYSEAIAYLRKENIHSDSLKPGYYLVTYQQSALGWIKCMSQRSNNLYPKNWKIRMHI